MPPDKGGAVEAFIFSISRQLSKMGHSVTILDRKYTRTELTIEQIDGVDITRLSAWRFPPFNSTIRYILNQVTFVFEVKRYLQKTKGYDVIHIHDAGGGFVLAMLGKDLRSRLVYTCHSSRRVEESPTLWDRIVFRLQNRLAKWASRTTVPNKLMSTSFIREAKVAPQKVVVVPHDVDVGMFNPELYVGDVRQRYGLTGRKVILFVGTIIQRKGVEYLVKAANIIVNESGYKDALFLLVGPSRAFGAQENGQTQYLIRVVNLIKSYNLDRNVKLTGAVPLDDLRKLYVACDIFVLPSLADLAPRAIPEAMACSKPVIATRVGGIPEQAEDGQSGFLIEPANERQLAEKIKYLMDNPGRAKEMGAYGRRLAEEEFSSNSIAEKLIKVYQSE